MKLFVPLCGLVSSLALGLGWISPVAATIVPDSTLPQASRVTRANRSKTRANRTPRTIVITAGTRRGQNLFHSFREFSIAAGETASFQAIDPSISNIFARVTGSHPSRINGILEVLQTDRQISAANLFLINPNGIRFGHRATLNLRGSLIATTAEKVRFLDGTQFSTVPSQTAALLTVSTPIGLQFGDRPGSIVNRSIAPVTDRNGNPITEPLFETALTGLNGTVGSTLALLGGNVSFVEGGSISSNGGRVEIGSVGSNEQVTLVPIAAGWNIGYAGVERFENIRFAGGPIQTQARIYSNTPLERSLPAGAVQIQGRQITLTSALILPVTSAQTGRAMHITASDTVLIDSSYLGTASLDRGQAGDLIISTRNLTILAGGRISSIAFEQGQSGNVRVNAAESVVIGEILPSFPGLDPTDRLSLLSVQSAGIGTVGDLDITTRRLAVRSGGQITAATTGTNDAGNISIRADQIELSGVAIDPSTGLPPLDATGLPLAGGLFVGTALGSSGNGGTLNITTRRLRVQDGATIQATTYGQGRAGNIQIQASDSIEVSGLSTQLPFPAQIAATSGGLPNFNPALVTTATGRGGNLDLRTDRLIIREGGVVAVNSRNPNAAGAGNIQIQANRIALDHRGQLNAQTESGNQARITLESVDLLTLQNNSSISTTAGRNRSGGDAGNISVNSDLILAAPAENSDIDADARQGEGGDITIQAEGILGIQERSQRTAQSDITATSESNVDGDISISTTTIDLMQGLVELPSTIVDASQLISQGCRVYQTVDRSTGEFIITGRGGLPPTPADLRSSNAVISDWATLLPSQSQVNSSDRTSSASLPDTTSPAQAGAIVEAQGWIKDDAGRVLLVDLGAKSARIGLDRAEC